jgi:hypothetical protein
MSIEATLERIANALEQLAAAKTTDVADPAPAAEQVAADAVKKAATRGRAKKTEPVEPEVKAEEAPEVEVKTEEAPAAPVFTVADLQKRASKLAVAHGKDAVFALINKAKGASGRISAHTPEQLVALNELFDQLEGQ